MIAMAGNGCIIVVQKSEREIDIGQTTDEGYY